MHLKIHIETHIKTLGWPKILFRFSVTAYGKIRKNFLANLIRLKELKSYGVSMTTMESN